MFIVSFASILVYLTVINVVTVQYSVGFLPDIMLLTLSMLLPPSGNPINCHEEFWSSQPVLCPPLISLLIGGCSEDWKVKVRLIYMRSYFLLLSHLEHPPNQRGKILPKRLQNNNKSFLL